MTEGFAGDPLVGALSGYRWWLIRGSGALASPRFGTVWDPRTTTASCLEEAMRFWPRRWRQDWRRRHVSGIPAGSCECGLYALHAPPAEAREGGVRRFWAHDPQGPHPDGLVLGVVHAWGRVVVGTEGFRAQFARPRALLAPAEHPVRRRPGALDRLRARHDLAVVEDLGSLVNGFGPRVEDVAVLLETT